MISATFIKRTSLLPMIHTGKAVTRHWDGSVNLYFDCQEQKCNIARDEIAFPRNRETIITH
jgi:hypothetical protein